MKSTGVLSVVATPIGNMEDITLRAVRVLRESDYVLCEDTRVTGKLLARHEIDATLVRYDVHSNQRVQDRVLVDLHEGKHIALVSDAGTPGVSDPGVMLVAAARAAGYRVDAVPGPSAVTAAISIAGLTGNQFSFLGFIPQKKGRQTFLADLELYDHPVVFFESPHRIMKLLEQLAEVIPAQIVVIARELTKLHEELVSGTASELIAYFNTYTDHQKGEFVVIVSPRR